MIAWLKKNEWILVAFAAGAGFLIGLVLLSIFKHPRKRGLSFRLFYLVIRLFLFSYDLQGDGVPYATTNPALEVARSYVQPQFFTLEFGG